jgi:ribosomal-protein-alanine N-acetyltransferase
MLCAENIRKIQKVDFPMDIRIRKTKKEDLSFLWKILYSAALWNPAENNPSIEIALSIPEIKKILTGWGRKGDTAIIAETNKQEKIGAAWYRYWTTENHSFGFVDENTPELGIAVILEFRSRGTGNKLLKALITEAKEQHIKALSLSVAKKILQYDYIKKTVSKF